MGLKPTPGPWIVLYGDVWNNQIHASDEDKTLIAVVQHLRDIELIKSAPAMFNALMYSMHNVYDYQCNHAKRVIPLLEKITDTNWRELNESNYKL